MRTRGRVYQEPRLSESERAHVQRCPRGCGSFVSEERQRGANGLLADVLFCLDEVCGWREWTVEDISADISRRARQGQSPSEIAVCLGVSERTVFRWLDRDSS